MVQAQTIIPLIGRVVTPSNATPEPGTKEYLDLRDRAAYVFITGANPTHLRGRMNAFLRMMTSYSRKPVSLDGRVGSIKIAEENIARLELENHPMVKKVRSYVDDGYNIQLATDWKARRPYSRILLFREETGGQVSRITVQCDGSMKEGWA